MTYQALSAALAAPQLATVTLSTAQIADLHNTGIECVPAPGVGKRLKALGFGGRKILNSVAFSGASNLTLVYGLSGSNALFTVVDSLITAAEDKDFDGGPSSGVALPTAEVENQPLVVKLAFAANLATGPVAAFTIAGGGADWEIGDTALIDHGFNADAQIEVDTVSGGAIATAHLVTGGTSNYEVQNGVALVSPSGTGTGATVNITDVTEPAAGNGSATVSVVFIPVDV